MENELFVVGDIHGCLSKFEELLKNWNPDNQQLVSLGDLVDRGEDSLGVIHRVMKLQKEYGAVVVGGNHEQIFLDWLRKPTVTAHYYYGLGGRETILSFLKHKNYKGEFEAFEMAQWILKYFPEEMKFIRGLPDYWEWENYLFVHAGVDLSKEDWRETDPQEFRWIRDKFHHGENKTGKTIIFGHTPTFNLHPDKSCGVWIPECQTKIGLDGGAVFGGLLLGLLIKDDAYEVYAA